MPVFVVSALAWLYFLLVQKVVGPFSVDELFFGHVFWLQSQGLEPYLDFNSQHFPTYFAMIQPLLSFSGESLEFMYSLRMISLVWLLCYIVLLSGVARLVKDIHPHCSYMKVFWGLFPILMMVANSARLLEIRPDSVSILLESLAWMLLVQAQLDPGDDKHAAALTVLSGFVFVIATLFAARTLVIMVVFAPLWLALVITSGRPNTKRLAIQAVLVGLALAIPFSLVFIDKIKAIVWFSLTVPHGTQGFPFSSRFFSITTVPVVFLWLIAAALCVQVIRTHTGPMRRVFIVVSGVILAQILLILVDPAPFEYSFGHATIGLLICFGLAPGMLMRDRRDSTNRAIGICAATSGVSISALFLGSLVFPVAMGRPAPAFVDFAFHNANSKEQYARTSTVELLNSLVRTDQIRSMGDQINLREEVCRRLDGPVMATFYAHPVCSKDASFYWFHLSWPSAYAHEMDFRNERAVGVSKEQLRQLLLEGRPELFIWSDLDRNGREIRPIADWVRSTLTGRYDIHLGYALLKKPV